VSGGGPYGSSKGERGGFGALCFARAVPPTGLLPTTRYPVSDPFWGEGGGWIMVCCSVGRCQRMSLSACSGKREKLTGCRSTQHSAESRAVRGAAFSPAGPRVDDPNACFPSPATLVWTTRPARGVRAEEEEERGDTQTLEQKVERRLLARLNNGMAYSSLYAL